MTFKPNEVVLRAVAGCSALTACLAASGATQYNLTAGGSVQFTAPSYVVDFGTSSTTSYGSGSFGSLYGLQGVAALGVTEEGLPLSSVQEGYNADRSRGVPVMPQVDVSPAKTIDVALGELGVELSGSMPLAVFALTLNEPSSAIGGGVGPRKESATSYISLDSFQVFVADQPLASAATYADLTSHAKLVYDLDFDYSSNTAKDRTILLDDALVRRSAPDLYVKIPASLFAAAGAVDTSRVYIYSKFGLQSGYGAEGGFEDWGFLRLGAGVARLELGAMVPESSTWLGGLAIAGMVGGMVWLRRRNA